MEWVIPGMMNENLENISICHQTLPGPKDQDKDEAIIRLQRLCWYCYDWGRILFTAGLEQDADTALNKSVEIILANCNKFYENKDSGQAILNDWLEITATSLDTEKPQIEIHMSITNLKILGKKRWYMKHNPFEFSLDMIKKGGHERTTRSGLMEHKTKICSNVLIETDSVPMSKDAIISTLHSYKKDEETGKHTIDQMITNPPSVYKPSMTNNPTGISPKSVKR